MFLWHKVGLGFFFCDQAVFHDHSLSITCITWIEYFLGFCEVILIYYFKRTIPGNSACSQGSDPGWRSYISLLLMQLNKIKNIHLIHCSKINSVIDWMDHILGNSDIWEIHDDEKIDFCKSLFWCQNLSMKSDQISTDGFDHYKKLVIFRQKLAL